ncbi:hypothetical protein B0J13DRAFT_444021 [Dactylonectria estremocensis]|uniref:Rhodopsin domain-containing protein n=1 Tax=Dactylonectria estremocensis TaxID=1079267 RepID=A0A9P9ETM3_9HYPO|nr:hypothetical protein B0J13DRAFT_444021 [Dactylonectria estremocensis]
MAPDPAATTVTPHGLALVLLVVSLFFVVPCTVVVLLRTWIRARHGVFGMDDGLMFAGWALFMGLIGILSSASYVGLGTRDVHLNADMKINGRFHVFMFQICYCCSLVFIKGSICVTLLRIAVIKAHRIIIWVTLITSCISSLIIVIALLAMCQPVSAAWGASPGHCAPTMILTGLSYMVSAASVAIDWVCAILPGFMLYKAQMKRQTKISITIILGLGVLASIATMVRLPYLKYYTQPEDYLYNVASIALWSVIESGIGTIAGSLPSLRRLLKNWVSFDSSVGQSPANITPFTGTNNATVTSKIATTGRPHNSLRSNMTGNRDWEPLDDASSSHKIYVHVDVEMQSLERTATSMRSGGSSEEVRMPA